MAEIFHFSIKGSKQGQFKGDATHEKRKDTWIRGLSFQYEVKAPRDAATGRSSGKRDHGTVIVTKEWGAATPQIFEALTKNETLTEVVFEFFKMNPNGGTYVYQTIKLTDATVSNIKLFTSDVHNTSTSTQHAAANTTKELETISFTFKKIEIENKDAKTAAADDWQVSA